MSHKYLPIVKQNTVAALSKTKNLMLTVNKILAQKGELSINDDSWMKRIWVWAEENMIQDTKLGFDQALNKRYYRGIPNNKDDLLHCEWLNLRWNRLKYLPIEICCLKDLRVLELMNNNLETLPNEIDNLINLEKLDLNLNQLRLLPNQIVNLKKLQYLSFKNNKNLQLTVEQKEWLEYLKQQGCVIRI